MSGWGTPRYSDSQGALVGLVLIALGVVLLASALVAGLTLQPPADNVTPRDCADRDNAAVCEGQTP